MHVPALSYPVGDPSGVRVAAGRLVGAAESIGVVAGGLSDLNQQAVQVWESQAQRLFSLVAGQFGQVIAGSAGVTTDISSALNRYAGILETCQGEVRLCRQRLETLVAATPAGMVPDPGAVNSIVGQANDAYARAAQAARELSAAALSLIGNPTANTVLPAAGDANASFVSRAHSGGLASTHPSAAAFDAQAAHIQAQMNGVMTSLVGLAGTTSRPNPDPGLYPSSTMIGGNSSGVPTSMDDGSGSTIGGDVSPGFVMDGGAYAASGQTVMGGSWSPTSSQVYITPAFPSGGQSSVTQPLGLPQRLPLHHPIIQSMIPGIYNDYSNQMAKSNRAFGNLVFNTPYDPYTPDGRP